LEIHEAPDIYPGLLHFDRCGYRIFAQPCKIKTKMSKATDKLAHIPPEWPAEFEAAAAARSNCGCATPSSRPISRLWTMPAIVSWDTTADYRRWCEENLPDWLGYGRV